MIIAGYFEDDASNELTNNPVFKAVLNKEAYAVVYGKFMYQKHLGLMKDVLSVR